MSQPGWGPRPPWPQQAAPPRSNRACCLVAALLAFGLVAAVAFVVGGFLYFRSTVAEVASSTPREVPTSPTPRQPSISTGPVTPPRLAPSAPDPETLPSNPSVPVHVENDRYEIAGATAAELRGDLNSKGPVDSFGRHDAMTTWYVDWRFPRDTTHGGCGTGPVRVEVKITYRVPEWRPGPGSSAELVARWNRYEVSLMKHEQGHAAHGIAAAEEVARELSKLPESPTCPILDAAVERRAQAVLDKHRAEDVAYDATTRHGATQGAVFP